MSQAGEDLAILFLDCVYDEHIHKITRFNLNDQISEATKVCGQIKSIQSSARIFSEKKMYLKTYNVEFLLAIAKLKFCLFVMAKVVSPNNNNLDTGSLHAFHQFNTDLRSLIQTHFKYSTNSEVIINYLAKELIRSYGSASLNRLLNTDNLNWIAPRHLINDNDEAIIDKYVINSRYLTFKDAIIKSFKEKKPAAVDEAVAACNYDYHPYLLMALYQNITLLYFNIGHVTDQILDIFKPVQQKYFEDKEHLTRAIFNNTFTHNLHVSKSNRGHTDLGLLLIQIKYCVLYSSCGLVASLKELITIPGEIALKYLPTMPQDDKYDVQKALQDGTTTKFYVCPNGHEYAIGECGRPWIKATCRECGADIGGVNHSLEKHNRIVDQASLVDRTLTGYLFCHF